MSAPTTARCVAQNALDRRGHAAPAHICTGTALTPPTSALGLGSPRPHLHWDWAHSALTCTGTRLAAPTSALELISLLPHLYKEDRAYASHICIRTGWAQQRWRTFERPNGNALASRSASSKREAMKIENACTRGSDVSAADSSSTDMPYRRRLAANTANASLERSTAQRSTLAHACAHSSMNARAQAHRQAHSCARAHTQALTLAHETLRGATGKAHYDRRPPARMRYTHSNSDTRAIGLQVRHTVLTVLTVRNRQTMHCRLVARVHSCAFAH